MPQHVIELVDQNPLPHVVLCLRQPAIIEEWCERPHETGTQRDGSVGARTEFCCVEDQQPFEPTLLLIRRVADRLEPGERA